MDGDHLKSLTSKTHFSRRDFVITGVTTGFALAAQPVQAQTIITTDAKGLIAEAIQIPVPDGKIPAYYARPDGKHSYPVVLVIQEIFGLHEHIQDICRRLAKAGYFAVAPALYARQGDPSKISDIQTLLKEIVSKVPDAQVASDLDATVAWAKNDKHADIGRLAVTGFCWGGRQVWLYAAHNRHLRAAVAWYGPVAGTTDELHPKRVLDLAQDIRAPVLGLYGAADQGIAVADVEKLRDELKAAHKYCKLVIYPDTPHGFNADYRPSYRPEAAKDGWKRMLEWFKQHGVA